MRWEKYRIAIITVSVIIVSLYNASAEVDHLSDSKSPILSLEDQRIDSQDLTTQRYDASHKKNYVELKLNNMFYKLAPNGEMPGLSDIII
jgi:hypothetical protein